MILHNNGMFYLQTPGSSYVFRVLQNGMVEHLSYGKKIKEQDPAEALIHTSAFGPGDSILLEKKEDSVSPEEMLLETSSYGKGDIREPLVTAEFADGSRTTDFRYAGYEIRSGKTTPEGMPGAYGTDQEVQELRVRFRDRMSHKQYSGLELFLVYDVFTDCDVIVKRSILVNRCNEPVKITRFMSSLLDFEDQEYEFHTFGGPWTREMEHFVHPVSHGRLVNGSVCGVSSNRNNPFTMLSRPETTEEFGECYGFNLIYSGNHYTSCEGSALGLTRVTTGIHPETFSYVLGPRKRLESPEAVLCYSDQGFRGMSLSMHHFVREHIVRGKWQHRERPVLLNSWEAAYFKITEAKILRMAKAAKDVGVELFVMDDGWFKGRNDETSSLGDWEADTKKLPEGLPGLSKKIRELGLKFGIWVEPEMVNENSDLYRAHPEWALRIPGRDHSEGRNQMFLDFTQDAVCDYIIESMKKVFKESRVSYVKWDMNRIFSDVFSQALPAAQQGEVAHRYVLGLYRVMDALTREFPNILFEGCASGGCRFDLGILCYMPQIWASDDTDAYARAGIQNSLSYGYPQSVMGAHVSECPNHQTLRTIPLDTRFAMASFGVLGYECNLAEMNSKDQKEIADQIAFYKQHRRLLQYGNLYRIPLRGRDARESGQYQWVIADPKQREAMGLFLQGIAKPHARRGVFRAAGLDPDQLYEFKNFRRKYDIREFGSLINTASPFHVRQNSLTHKAMAQFVHMDNEVEECKAYGDTLMNHGVRLKDAFSAVGYSDQVRLFKDFESRLYYMKKV